MRRSALLVTLVLFTGAAHAEGPTPPTMSKEESQSLDVFAEAHKDCKEWTDACVVCQRRNDGTFGCSLPGIACQPQVLACRTPPSAPTEAK